MENRKTIILSMLYDTSTMDYGQKRRGCKNNLIILDQSIIPVEDEHHF
jgi:hypothetical protein